MEFMWSGFEKEQFQKWFSGIRVFGILCQPKDDPEHLDLQIRKFQLKKPENQRINNR